MSAKSNVMLVWAMATLVISPFSIASEAAGVVTMTIGKAYLNGDTLIKSGTELQAGDNIETLSNGHVHIRFIDNGLVSVRPNSHLFIEHYDYNSESPEQSVIKFDLDSGVMRSISGKGAKAARDKFRLNTPIAAIGVRGTDFVVKASSDLLQAVVNEGAIVVAPFSSACEADTLGPCTENSIELNGDTKQLLELSALTASPRLVPLSEAFANELGVSHSDKEKSETNSIKLQTRSEEETDPTSNDQANESSTSQSGVSTPVNGNNTATDPIQVKLNGKGISFSTLLELANKDEFSEEDRKKLEDLSIDQDDLAHILEQININEILSDDPTPDNYVPTTPLTQEEQNSRQIAWGRFNSEPLSTDRIITSYAVAREGNQGKRDSFTMSMGNTIYFLFRNKSERSQIDYDLGKINLKLVDAQATLTTLDGDQDLMSVSDGWMSLDFNKATFSTGIIANHDLAQDVQISSSGDIRSNGVFNTTNGDTLKGLTTLDGTAAGTIFSKDIDVGVVQGAAYFSK